METIYRPSRPDCPEMFLNNCGDHNNSDDHVETRLDWIWVTLVLRHSQPAARITGFKHVDYFCKEKYETARSLAEIVNG